MRELCRHWLEGYDWPAAQARLNGFPQFMTGIDGLGIHFIHVRSPHPGATPLVITHGWPGSVVEFRKVIGALTDPVAFGGNAADAFHVVCPSLPGYGFSGKPTRPGWGVERIADAWDQLMARLGYPRYGAQGGDWGSRVAMALGLRHPAHVIGIHLNMVVAFPDPGAPGTAGELTEREQEALAAFRRHRAQGSGYAMAQSTRPQSIGYGLVDSPAGALRLDRREVPGVERLRRRPGQRPHQGRNAGQHHAVLADRQRGVGRPPVLGELRQAHETPVSRPVLDLPQGDLPHVRRWAEPQFPDLRYWNELERGGHFAAFEQPSMFVDEVRAAFRAFR